MKSNKYSKTKGSAYEYAIKKELINLGYDDAVTTRSESKAMDAKKVDIMSSAPFNIQCKCTQKTPQIIDIFKDYSSHNLHKPLAIFWKSQKMNDEKTRCKSQGEYVILRKEDFYSLINKDINEKKCNQENLLQMKNQNNS